LCCLKCAIETEVLRTAIAFPAGAGPTGKLLHTSPDAKVLMAEALLSQSSSEQALQEAKTLMDSAIQQWPQYSRGVPRVA